ncbi:LytR/AlgR family response regulator transcription factor [Cohnella mopanensis]|uniref:LytR/AlgR family response regulator transcription factor n=1 Tax=Cohnella mopanensis TaxID=2911966 RepID=UPI001EF7F860|nr:hypothetical protein [Cohnella mopanensis]
MKVVIIDDEKAMHFMMKRMLTEVGDVEIVGRLHGESGREMKLVFVTAHQEYALFAFEVNAFDYIVKPVKQDRLHKTVQRALAEML